jgi:two-component system chemotaxis response regulator CheB
LQALEAGAADYLTKDIRSWVDKSNSTQYILVERVVALGRGRGGRRRTPAFVAKPLKTGATSSVHSFGAPGSTHARKVETNNTASSPSHSLGGIEAATATRAPLVRRTHNGASFPVNCKLVVIGSSTGGPAALQTILMALPANFPYPILLVQHMPKTFTSVFAERLDQQCNIEVKEAEDGDRFKAGRALLVPGGHQVMIESRQPDRVKILLGDERTTYRPSVDIAYAAAAKIYGNKVLAIILTGMGADGAEGARLLKQAGAVMWAQNEASCTIYGMPQAVIKAELADDVMDLNDISRLLMSGGK